MSLKEILQKLAQDGNPKLLGSDKTPTEAGVQLVTLSEGMLKVKAHLQPGMYIAEINDSGYLGTVLFRFK